MKDFNINVPRNVGIAIIAAIAIFSLGGYILYFNAKGALNDKQREMDVLKEKTSNAEANYNDMKKQLDNSQEDLRQVSKDHDALVEKHSECKIRLEEQNSKAEDVMQLYDRCKKDLTEFQNKNGSTSSSSSTTTTTDSKKDESSTTKDKKEEKKDSSSALDSHTKVALNCPSSEEVTLNAKLGQWQSEKLKWWVDYSSRPLNDGENVKDLYKMLYDGNSVACYYSLGTSGEGGIWIVVKGAHADKTPLTLGNEGWTPCPTEECKSICEKENLSQCHFGANSI